MPGLLQDVTFAARVLRRTPAFTATAVLTMGICIGANAVNFRIAHLFLFRPLPGITEPSALVRLNQTLSREQTYGDVSWREYQLYRQQAASFEGLLGWIGCIANAGHRGAAEQVEVGLVTGNYFSVFGVQPAIGRVFSPEETAIPGGRAVAIVSHAYWTGRLGADPTPLGKMLRLNGQEYTIVGVAPQRFEGTEFWSRIKIWVPLARAGHFAVDLPGTNVLDDPNSRPVTVIGRLKRGVTLDQARAEVQVIAQRLQAGLPDRKRIIHATLQQNIAIGADWLADIARILGVLTGLSGALLAAGAANLATLLLARSLRRRAELAVRLAVGASRTRLIRLLVCESLLITLGGAAFAIVAAAWTADIILATAGPVPHQTALGSGVLAAVFGVTILAGLLAGLIPGWQASRGDLATAVKSSTANPPGYARWQAALVVAQVSVSFALLIVSGLLVRTLYAYRTADYGFARDRLLVGPIDLRSPGYREDTGRVMYRRVIEAAETVPGVRRAALASGPPVGVWFGWTAHISGEGKDFEAGKLVVSPRYFDTLETPLLRGREFTDKDTSKSPLVAIVNESLARRLWPDGQAIGRRLDLVYFAARKQVEVVGIAPNVRHSDVGRPVRPWIYLPLLQHYEPNVTLHARTVAGAEAMRSPLGKAVGQLDPDMPPLAMQTMAELLRDSVAEKRILAVNATAFAVLALLLAAVGLYGVTTSAVSARSHEIGVRLAVGADQSDVVGLFVRRGLFLATVGGVGGAAIGVAASGLLNNFVAGVSPTDPVTYATVALVVCATALCGSYLPARCLSGMDPANILRSE